jgi:heme exporter protein A
MMHAVQGRGLAIRRGERRLFSGLDFRLEAGSALALTGANGSGKTSLLRAIAGLIRPEAGEVRFEGAPDAETARCEELHLLGHADGLKGARTALEELSFQASWLGGGVSRLPVIDSIAGCATSLPMRPLRSPGSKRLSFREPV